MASVNYPSNIPLHQRASQNMTSDTPFKAVQPAVGPPIFIEQTVDQKTTWSLTWVFTLNQAQIFKSWLRSPNYCNRGNSWFNLPIDLGDMQGVQLQEVHFTADGYPVQTSKDGNTVTWSATVITRGIQDATEDYDDWIVDAPAGWGDYWLDYVASKEIPESK